MDKENFFLPSNPLHDEADQLKRQNAALKLNVQSVDSAAATGKINDYDVSLDFCPCIDFSRRHLPCKHMYRLAHELGVFPLAGKVVNDPAVRNTVATKHTRTALKQAIAELPKRAQEILQECVSLNDRFFNNSFQSDIQALVNAGFATTRPITFFDIADQFTIADMLEMCPNEKPSSKNRRKPVIDFFVEHYSDNAKQVVDDLHGDDVYIEVTNVIQTDIATVQRFLARILGKVYRSNFDVHGHYSEKEMIVRELPELPLS